MFFALCRQMKETAMAESEKLAETGEEVRHLKNHAASGSSKLSVPEDLDGSTHLSLYSCISVIGI